MIRFEVQTPFGVMEYQFYELFMSDELKELAAMEGATANRPPKPIVEMTDEELTAWVQTMRGNLTQYQTLVAEARVSKGGSKKEPNAGDLNMFE